MQIDCYNPPNADKAAELLIAEVCQREGVAFSDPGEEHVYIGRPYVRNSSAFALMVSPDFRTRMYQVGLSDWSWLNVVDYHSWSRTPSGYY